MVGVRFRAETRDVSLLQSVQTGFGAHSASYPTGTGGCFPRINAAQASSIEVKNRGVITPLLHVSLWHSDRLIKHNNNNNFTFSSQQVTAVRKQQPEMHTATFIESVHWK
jgi:hypothetical protein